MSPDWQETQLLEVTGMAKSDFLTAKLSHRPAHKVTLIAPRQWCPHHKSWPVSLSANLFSQRVLGNTAQKLAHSHPPCSSSSPYPCPLSSYTLGHHYQYNELGLHCTLAQVSSRVIIYVIVLKLKSHKGQKYSLNVGKNQYSIIKSGGDWHAVCILSK